MLRVWRWPLLWALLILLLCLMPGAALPGWDWADLFSVDKLVHAGLFAVLAALAFRALPHRSALIVAVTALACMAYGGTLELMQQLPVLGRRGDWNDFLANGIGVCLGWAWQGRPWGKGRPIAARSNA